MTTFQTDALVVCANPESHRDLLVTNNYLLLLCLVIVMGALIQNNFHEKLITLTHPITNLLFRLDQISFAETNI